jgi:hypothetical protein
MVAPLLSEERGAPVPHEPSDHASSRQLRIGTGAARQGAAEPPFLLVQRSGTRQGVLDWLALGSDEAWDLNTEWIASRGKHIGPKGVFPFVISGQQIDRKHYDNLNSYTGELGSDGVVRVASANLQANHVRLEQQQPVEKLHPKTRKRTGEYHAPEFHGRGISPSATCGLSASRSGLLAQVP